MVCACPVFVGDKGTQKVIQLEPNITHLIECENDNTLKKMDARIQQYCYIWKNGWIKWVEYSHTSLGH